MATVAVDGARANEFVASLVLELASGELLSNAGRLVGMQLASGEQLARLSVGSSEEATAGHDLEGEDEPTVVVWAVESDDPLAEHLVATARQGQLARDRPFPLVPADGDRRDRSCAGLVAPRQ